MKGLVPFIILSLGLCSCAPPGGEAAKDNPNPEPVKTDVKLTGNLDVAVFEGGYKLDFYEKAGKELQEKNPDLKVKVWGNPRVWEVLRPRFLGNDPPDVTWPGWGMDYWALVYGGQIHDLNAELDGPAGDGSGTWRETFDAKLLKLGEYEGKQFLLPHHVNVMGWWYSPTLFNENGWTPPKTYEELLELAPKIRAKGIDPVIFQGQYPYYMLYGFIYPWVISSGGIGALHDAFNLKPGAWKTPAFLKAAQMMTELRDKGVFSKSTMGLNHTESQQRFLDRKAALIPCGTWLHSEMAETMKPGSDMAFMRIPVLSDDKGGLAIQAGIEPWIIPAKAKNMAAGIAYYKYITSLEKSKEFVRTKGTLTAIKGSEDTELPPYLVDAAQALKLSTTVWSADYRLWYPTLGKASEDALAALLLGEISPEQFCDRCEAAAQKVANDAKIPKHTVAP